MIYKCSKCKTYTLRSACKCGGSVIDPHPPKFSIEKEKKYAKYRRMGKE